MAFHVVIVGAGVAGLTAAVALKKYVTNPQLHVTVIEIRSTPSNLGGAVGLTPKAVRYLDHLGALDILKAKGAGTEVKAIEIFDLYTGKKHAELNFTGHDGNGIGQSGSKYHARRVMRFRIQEALLEVCTKQECLEVLFGRKLQAITESPAGVELTFSDDKKMNADLVLGCDGIHSAVRRLLVDPERQPEYTGVAVSMAISEVRSPDQVRWHTTGLASSRRGSLMASFVDDVRNQQYLAAVIESPGSGSRDNLRASDQQQKDMKSDLLQRFESQTFPELGQLIRDANEWTLYYVHSLPAGGKWISPGGRCVLLGDAAHAMAPQGESTGICIEDAVVFSRAMLHYQEHDLVDILTSYERYRRPKADQAYAEAAQRWENVKDKGWLKHKLLLWATPWFLWFTQSAREADFAADLTTLDVEITASPRAS